MKPTERASTVEMSLYNLQQATRDTHREVITRAIEEAIDDAEDQFKGKVKGIVSALRGDYKRCPLCGNEQCFPECGVSELAIYLGITADWLVEEGD